MKNRLLLIALVIVGSVAVPPQTVSAKPKALPKCPTVNFMNLSKSVGAGPSYAKPSQKIACSATEIAVTTNNMISFPFVQLTKSKNKMTGTATFLFVYPSIFTNYSFHSNTLNGMFLVWEKKKIQTNDVTIFFRNGQPFLIK